MRNKTLIISAVAMTLCLTSCGSKTNVIRADELSGEDFIDVNIQQGDPIKVPEVTVEPAKKVTFPAKHKEDNKASEEKKRIEKPLPHASSTALNGEWVIVKAGNKDIIQDEDMPYIIFAEKEGRFYIFDGCNTINGDYSLNEQKDIVFSNTLSTLMECPHLNYTGDIDKVVQANAPIQTKIEKIKNESYLTLLVNGKVMMKLRRHNLEEFSGQWSVAKIGDTVVDGDEANVFMDIPELTIHGNTGCNFFNGIIVVDPTVESSISFAQMGVTQKLCPNADTERKMLVALEEVCTYEAQGQNVLLLKDYEGNTVITLARVE